jgi:hypothetical protein
MRILMTTEEAKAIVQRFYHNPYDLKEPIRYYRHAADRPQRYNLTQEQACSYLGMTRNELVGYTKRGNYPMPHCVVKVPDGGEAAGRYYDPRELKAWAEMHLG